MCLWGVDVVDVSILVVQNQGVGVRLPSNLKGLMEGIFISIYSLMGYLGFGTKDEIRKSFSRMKNNGFFLNHLVHTFLPQNPNSRPKATPVFTSFHEVTTLFAICHLKKKVLLDLLLHCYSIVYKIGMFLIIHIARLSNTLSKGF